jgi:hypothetical protein
MNSSQTTHSGSNTSIVKQVLPGVLMLMVVLGPIKAVMADSGSDGKAKAAAFEQKFMNRDGAAQTLQAGEAAQARRNPAPQAQADGYSSEVEHLDPETRERLRQRGEQAQQARTSRGSEEHLEQNSAQRESLDEKDFRRQFAAKPNAVNVLKRGKKAQDDRYRREWEQLDAETQAQIEDAAKKSGERGEQARHVRKHAERMQYFEENTPAGTRTATEVIGDAPAVPPRRVIPPRRVTFAPEVREPNANPSPVRRAPRYEPGETRRASEAIENSPGTRAHVTEPGTPRARAAKPPVRRLAKAAKFAGKGAVVGVAVDVVTCGQAPDAVQGGEWVVGTMRKPGQAGQRTEKLAQGAGQLVADSARNVTSPKRLSGCAVNAVKGVGDAVVGIGEYGASRATHPELLVHDSESVINTAGKVTYAVGDGVYQTAKYSNRQIQKSMQPLNRTNEMAARTAGKAAKSAGCAIAGVFKKPKGCK